MAIFNPLPNVDYCCCCINLKWGCILIVIYSILNFGITAVSMYYSSCRDQSGTYRTIMDIAGFVVFTTNLFLVIAGVLFVFGIIKMIPKTATIFMYGILLSLLAYVAYVLLSIALVFLYPDCKDYTNLFVPIVTILVWLYFLVVVKSYRDEM